MNPYHKVVSKRLHSGEFAPGDTGSAEGKLYRDWETARDLPSKTLLAAQAIGLSPLDPPIWARLACWLYREVELRNVKTGNFDPDRMADMLDLTIWNLLELEDQYWDTHPHTPDDGREVPAKPFARQLQRAIRSALKQAPDRIHAEKAIERRWADEQKNDGREAETPVIAGYLDTPRIRRVAKRWSEWRMHASPLDEEAPLISEYQAVFELMDSFQRQKT